MITITQITSLVSAQYGLTPDALRSKSRHMKVTRARHVAMYLAYHEAEATDKAVGAFFGGRDHSTVNQARRNIAAHMEIYPELRENVEAIRRQIEVKA